MASLRDIGQSLKEAREAQGLTLEDIAARTRITVRHLMALEEGNEADLPEVFYVRGFLKKYAEAVGLSPKDVADAYRAAPIPTTTAPTMGSSAGPLIRGVLVLGLIGGIMYLAWYFQPKLSVVAELSPSPSPSIAATAQPAATGAEGATSAAAASTAASPKPKGSQKPGSPKPSPKGSAKPGAKPSGKPGAKPSPKASPAASPKPSPSPSAAASASPQPAASPRPSSSPRPSASPSAKGGTVTVELTIEQRSWVEVRVDGKGAFEGLLSPKAHKSFKGHSVEVSAGNAGGVRITINGHNQGKLGERGVVVAKTFKP